MVAYLVAVAVLLRGAVRGTSDITELDFMQGFRRIGVDRKGDLEQPVLLLPVKLRDKIQPCRIMPQQNRLFQIRIVYPASDDQRRAVVVLLYGNLHRRIQRNGHIFIHAADFPCIVAGVDVLEHQQPVAAAGEVLSAAVRFAHAGQFAVSIHHADQMLIAQFKAGIRAAHRGSRRIRRTGGNLRTPLRRDQLTAVTRRPAQMIVYGFGLRTEHFAEQLPAAIRHRLQFSLRAFVHARNGRARRHVMKLVKQRELPALLQLLPPLGHNRLALQHPPGQMIFHLFECRFRLADAAFGAALRGERASVPCQIQFAAVDVFHVLLAFKIPDRAFHATARCALQIAAAARQLDHLARGASASVAEAEGIHQSVDVLLLDAVVLPAGNQIAGIKIGIVLFEQMRKHAAAVHALPPEQIVRERLGFRILPHQLLRGKIRHLTFFQNLRQRS